MHQPKALISLFAVLAMTPCSAVLAQAAAEASATPSPAPDGTPAAPSPKARCDRLVYDFGEAWSGDKIENAFEIANDGNAVLEITEVKPTCGCTATEYDKTIAPGKTGKVKAVVNTLRMRSRISKHVLVTTNDAANRQLTLTIEGNVKERLQMEPSQGAQFGKVVVGAAVEPQKIRITNNTDKPAKLELDTSNQPDASFKVTIAEIDAGKVYEVTVAPEQPRQEGNRFTQLRLKTGVAEEPEILVPCSLYVAPEVETMPPAIVVSGPLTRETTRRVQITFNSPGEWNVTGAELDNPKITARIDEQNRGKEYGVTVTIPQGTVIPSGKPAQLTVTTNHQKYPRIVVPIQMQMAPQPQTAPAVADGAPAQTQPSAQLPPQPMLAVEALRQETGAHKPGEDVTYKLYYTNGGGVPLTIAGVSGSEGTSIEPGYTTTVEPSRTGAADVKFKAPEQPGEFTRTVTIQSNDTTRNPLVVTLTGTVKPFIEVTPPAIDFSRNPRIHSMPRLATVAYNGEGTVNFLKAETDTPKFKARLEPIPNSPYQKMIIEAVPPFEQGETKGVIRIHTDHAVQKLVEVPVTLFMPARVELTPSEVVLTPSTRLQQSAVLISNNGEKPLHILEVTRGDDSIRTQFYPESDGMSYRLRMTFPANFAPSNGSTQITIRTDDPEYKQIVIPIRAGEAKAVSAAP